MRLNLGCGDLHLEDWKNIDLPDVDLGKFPWKWKSNSVDEILASHILEHFDRLTALKFLEECKRILKSNGVLHIAVPDMDKFIDCHLSGDFSPLGGYRWTDLNHFMGGDSSERKPELRHKYMWNWYSLAYVLDRVGFSEVIKSEPTEIDNLKYAAFSLYVDAYA